MIRSIKLPAAFIAMFILSGCAAEADRALPPPPERPAEKRIAIDSFSFTPAEVVVAPGTKVTWVNHDDVPHTVTANDKSFTSSALDTDDSFSHTFTAKGIYAYYCAVHPHMTARIVVN
jgi:plastocyanin